MKPAVICILGPTASGKSELGLAVAGKLGGEIINCDSVQVFRGLFIGAGKIPADQRQGIPHHLYDVVDCGEMVSAGQYMQWGRQAIGEVLSRNRIPVVVGGTGLYLRALIGGLFEGPARDDALRDRLRRVAERKGVNYLRRWLERIDPEYAQVIGARDRLRLIRALEVYLMTGLPMTQQFRQRAVEPLDGLYQIEKVGLNLPRLELSHRIDRRVQRMFDEGFLEETRQAVGRGCPATGSGLDGIGYRQCVAVLEGRMTLEQAVLETKLRTRQYAKRQMTWFRKEPDVAWFETAGELPETQESVLRHLQERLEGTRGV